MVKYELSYDRRECAYTLTWPDGARVFNSVHLTGMWRWIGDALEPGDTLEWVREHG